MVSGLEGKETAWSMDELKKMEVVKLAVDHPKKGKMDVEGVSLNALLDLAGLKTGAQKLVLIAADGYTIEANLKDIRDCKNSLVSFTSTGGLNLVLPDMESSFWVKDITILTVK